MRTKPIPTTSRFPGKISERTLAVTELSMKYHPDKNLGDGAAEADVRTQAI